MSADMVFDDDLFDDLPDDVEEWGVPVALGQAWCGR